MRLTKDEFIEVYEDVKSAVTETNKMQEAIAILCPDSYPILKDPYESIYFKLIKKLIDDDIEDCFYGGTTKAWLDGKDGKKEYDLTNPESYYDFLTAIEKDEEEKKEEKS